MEMQRPKNKPRKTFLEEEKGGRTYFSHITGLITVIIIETVRYWYKQRQTEQWKQRVSSETHHT